MMPLISPVDQIAIGVVVVCCLVLAGFSVHWFKQYYRQTKNNPDPLSPAFMLREFLNLNLFICIPAVILLYTFGLQIITPVVWLAASFSMVVGVYLLIKAEIQEQKKRSKKRE